MSKAWLHFKTITHHRILVCKGCFKVGLYWQGLTHDLSKYSPTEFKIGAKYYQGTCSPNGAERKEFGYSTAWMHHKGRNKHHTEYWVDFCCSKDENDVYRPAPMPDRYIAEMIMDRIAASKTYEGDKYTDNSALNYYHRENPNNPMHPETRAKLLKYLTMLSEKGEKETFKVIKKELVHK